MKTQLPTFVLYTAVLFALVLAGCNSNAQPPQQIANTPVRTASVSQHTRGLPIHTSGRLAPKSKVQLSFKTGGLIDQIYTDEGRTVKAGDLLARLNLSEIDAQVQQAKSGYEKAKRDAARLEALYRDSVVTLERWENASTALEVSHSALRIADFNRQHSEIRAPAAGQILRRMAEPNELVKPGETVLVLGAAKGWVVRVGVADRDVVKLGYGDTARLRFDAYPERSFEGWVSEIAEAADPMTGTFEIEVTITDTQGLLKTGFIAQVDLLPAQQEPFYFIPVTALVEGDGTEGMVYGLDPVTSRAHKFPVHIAHILNDTLAIRSGLETVTSVITEGAAYLTDGAQVDVISSN